MRESPDPMGAVTGNVSIAKFPMAEHRSTYAPSAGKSSCRRAMDTFSAAPPECGSSNSEPNAFFSRTLAHVHHRASGPSNHFCTYCLRTAPIQLGAPALTWGTRCLVNFQVTNWIDVYAGYS